jgi:hypothetical protein
VKSFEILIDIDPTLSEFFSDIERHFSIRLDEGVVAKIFKDLKDDQVNEKEYTLFVGKKRFLRAPIRVLGKVDAHEPQDIFIRIENVKNDDLKFLRELVDDHLFKRRRWKPG